MTYDDWKLDYPENYDNVDGEHPEDCECIDCVLDRQAKFRKGDACRSSE